jgi:hypothetical protein
MGALVPVFVLVGPAKGAVLTTSQTLTLQPTTLSLTIRAVGGAGGNSGAAVGGRGASVSAQIPATPGETISIIVGTNGDNGNDSNPLSTGTGADGGGLSGISSQNNTRRVVAGGGGGAAGQGLLGILAGGDAGEAPTTGSGTGPFCGPGANGTDGTFGQPVLAGGGGGGASCTAGGAAGAGLLAAGSPGTSGAGGQGGAGAVLGGNGGDGGDGLFGGGGGGGGSIAGGGGGAGAGSSFVLNGANVAMAPTSDTPRVEIVENDFPVRGTPECSDNQNNDPSEDTLIDAADPGCHSDGNAANTASYNASDDSELNASQPPPPVSQCSDNVDNADPEDTLADEDDPGCHSDGNARNASSYVPSDNNETDGVDQNGIDLVVEMTSNKARVNKGRRVGFSMTVRNNGPMVANKVELIVRIAKNLRALNATGNGCAQPAPNSNEVHCTIETIPPKESVLIVVEARARRGGSLSSTAEVIPTQINEITPTDNKDAVQVKVRRGKRHHHRR